MGNIVLVGAGGTGMSGVAGLLHDLGYTNLVCIDGFQSELTDKLEKKGIHMIIGHNKYEPKLDDVIIYSEATANSPEIKKAKMLTKKNKKTMLIMNYFQFLGEISKYFITIGFAGTNGKSTTTAMAIHIAKNILQNFGLGILGALVPQFNNENYYLNTDHISDIKAIFDFILTGKNFPTLNTHHSSIIKKLYFFVEACEYKRHFLYLDNDYTIITSLELDHTDYYKDIHDYLDAFLTLAKKTKQKIFIPKNIKFTPGNGLKNIVKIPIKKINFKYLRGKYNDNNGSLVLALFKALGKSGALQHLLEFKGLRRRMEYLGTNKNGAKIYSDYGHMASSILGGYYALKEKYPDKKLLIIFQPHQINRLLLGRNDFVKAIQAYDKIIIYDIYAAREKISELIKKFKFQNINKKKITKKEELGKIFAKACGGIYLSQKEKMIKEIGSLNKDTIIVIFSAGDIDYQIRTSNIIKNKS